jgi:hypothetical protein
VSVIKTSISEVAGPCGVIVVDCGTIDPAWREHEWRVKWSIVYDFLSANPYQFQRFIMVDGYDTFFQGDVFDDTITENKLYFASELILINQRSMPKGWTEAFSSILANRTKQPPLIAAVPSLGGVEPFLKFCRLLANVPGWAQWTKPSSQALAINYVILLGTVTRSEIPYELIPLGGIIASGRYAERRRAPAYDPNGYPIVPGVQVASMVISQYSAHQKGLGAAIRGLCVADEIQWSFKIEAIK